MVSIYLKDVYLQIPIHPSSRKYLGFTARGRAWQFKVLCFGLSTAPQVFSQVMALVSSFLHQSGVRMLRYLDDWLILVSSRKEACWAGDKVLSLSRTRGHCEFGQVFARSVSVSGLSGDQDRVADFLGFTDSLEDRKVLLNSRRISVLKGAVCEVLEGSASPPRVFDACCSGKSLSHESSSVGSQAELGLLRRLGLDQLGLPFSRRSSVVVRRGPSRGGCFAGRSLSRPHVLDQG